MITLNSLGLTTYDQGWNTVATDALDCANVASAEVTTKDFQQDDGSIKARVSICFHLSGGGTNYIALDRDSKLNIGDSVALDSVVVKTMEKDGRTIFRADGAKA